ncbi:MAG: PH domain-containing protein [Candidatus Levyibacteriota bacterium]
MADKQSRTKEDIYISSSYSSKKPLPLANSVSPNIISDKASEHIGLSQKIIKPRPITKTTYEYIYEKLRMQNPNEKIIWIGRSSQVIHFTAYLICAIFCWLIIPLLIAYIIYLQTKNRIYIVTQERVLVYSGVFTKRVDDLELYRIKDTAYFQPFIFRFFNLASIQFFTSDISWGDSVIPGIENGMELREKIRRIVEIARAKKGIREVDYYNRHAPINHPVG